MTHAKSIIIFVFACLLMSTAKASLLIEPHLGYIIHGNADYDPSATTYMGPQYGIRVGPQLAGVMGGIDYTHSNFTYETTQSGTTTINDDKKRDQYGIFIGYNFPPIIRAWFTYYFLDKLSQLKDGAHGTAGSWSKGTGTEFGVGITALPFVSFNIVYRVADYDKDSGSALKHDANPKEITIGVSVPFTLL